MAPSNMTTDSLIDKLTTEKKITFAAKYTPREYALGKIDGINCAIDLIRQHEAEQPQDVVRKLEVCKNVLRFADGRCWPEVQAAIDANRSIIDV